MRSREEYVRFINERTGFDIGSDDPTLVFLACFELFEKDFRELAKNTLGSWIPLLDSRRKSFDDTVRLRTEQVSADIGEIRRINIARGFPVQPIQDETREDVHLIAVQFAASSSEHMLRKGDVVGGLDRQGEVAFCHGVVGHLRGKIGSDPLSEAVEHGVPCRFLHFGKLLAAQPYLRDMDRDTGPVGYHLIPELVARPCRICEQCVDGRQ